MMPTRKQKSAPPKTLGQRLRRLSLAAVAAALILTLAVMLPLRWFHPPTTAFMLRERLRGTPVDYRWVPINRISAQAALAVIAAEDQQFFNHWGIDLEAIADAIADNRSRRRPRGASTISQQVVKNLFLWPGYSYARKAIELYLTTVMELLWPKRRILEVYLNIAEMGRGVFGVQAASRQFFNKAAADLDRREAAVLAAVLPNPRKMSARQPSDYVRYRAGQIARQMAALGGIGFLERRLRNP